MTLFSYEMIKELIRRVFSETRGISSLDNVDLFEKAAQEAGYSYRPCILFFMLKTPLGLEVRSQHFDTVGNPITREQFKKLITLHKSLST